MAQAAVQPAPFEVAVVQSVGELAALGPAPVSNSAGFAAVETAAKVADAPSVEAPLIKVPAGPAKMAVPAAPVKLALADIPTPDRVRVSGSHLVQLGAFSSTANAEKAWNQYSKRYGVLKDSSSASSTVTINGKKLVRLAAAGFGSQAAAATACSQIKSMGGVCLVRSAVGTQPARMAGNQNRRIAAR
jgi:cell division protein FtsN